MILNINRLIKNHAVLRSVVAATILLSVHLQGALAQFNMFYSSDYDLPNNLINQVVEAKDGQVWVATEEGLLRFNGSRFITYMNDASNPASLADNFVRTVCSDSKGNIAVGTTRGLQFYHKKTNDFSPLVSDQVLGIPSANVNQIRLRGNGDFIISGYPTYIVRLDENGRPAIVDCALSRKKHESYRVIEAKKDEFIIVKQQKGTYYMDAKGKVVQLKINGGVAADFNSLCATPDGKIYAGSSVRGIYLFNAAGKSFDLIPGTECVAKIRDMILLPGTNTICVATDGTGVKFFDYQLRSVVAKNAYGDSFLDMSRQKVHSLYINKEGEMWMALFQRGIMMASPTAQPFLYIGYRSANYNVIGDKCVVSLMQTHEGNIWVSTDNGGLYGFTQDMTPLRQFFSTDGGVMPNTMLGLFEDSRHRVWYGSYMKGFGMIDLNTGKCTMIPLKGGDGSAISVFGFAEDAHGQIWIASLGKGILKYNEATGEAEPIHVDEGMQWLTSIYYDSVSKQIYASTYSGVMQFSPYDKKCKIRVLEHDKIVFSVTRVSSSQLGFATNMGILLYDTKTGKSKLITTRQGLPRNCIYALLADKDGHLWASSTGGLTRLDLKSYTMENYTMRDGLQGNEFYKNAAMKTMDGRMWFGGTNGITSFVPSDINLRPKTCKVIMARVFNGDREYFADEDGVYVIGDSEGRLSLEFATRPLSMTRRVVYCYKIDNGEWEMLPLSVNRVSLTKLGYGKHTVSMKTMIDGNEMEITETTVYMEWPWYLRWWALLLWFAIIAVLAARSVIGFRKRHKMRRIYMAERREKEQNEQKLQFFMNIVHDLRTPLTLLSAPLQKLMGADLDETRQHLYAIMNRNVGRLLQLTDQLMDLRKIDKGMMDIQCMETRVTPYILDIVNSVQDMADSRKVNLQFVDETDGGITAWLDTDAVEKILLNLLSNALKYTPEEGKVTVTQRVENGKLSLFVTDTGTGIPDGEKSNIFKRFYQVRGESGKHVKGTGIGLNLVQSLVQLHHGTITVMDNPEGQGTRFVVMLPVDKSAYAESEISNKVREVVKPALENAGTIDEIAEEAPAKESSRSSKRKTVLVIDDDDEIRNFLCEELAGLYNVMDCADGKSAWNVLKKSSVDLVVSDVMMPEIDGIELCRLIRQNVRIGHIPVVLLTAKVSDQDRIEGLSASADAYVTKPFNIDLLFTVVSNLLLRHDKLRNTFSGHELPTQEIELPQLQSADEKLLEKLNKIINDNLSNPDLTSDFVAQEVGLSRVHLYRKLKELTNQSASNYIRNIRLAKAAEILRQKKATVSEVAYLVGFRTPNHFATLFKELYGMTPTEYMHSA